MQETIRKTPSILRRDAALSTALWLGLLLVSRTSAEDVACTHQEDVIYGRKYGTALTMDVFTPKQDANGAGLMIVASGAWVSTHDWVETVLAEAIKRVKGN